LPPSTTSSGQNLIASAISAILFIVDYLHDRPQAREGDCP
jgi:hypothetical protein